MGHYVGVDVGLRSSSLCIIDEQGKVCLEREVASEIDEIADAIGGFSEHVDGVALETGNLTPWLTAGLRAEGFRVVVMEARQVKTTLSSLRNKTDRNDARGIAQILRTGWYREVHVKSLESQRLKTLLAARRALLRRRIDLENEVRGLLKVYGFKLPAQIYHARFEDMSRQAVMADPALAEALGPLLDARGHLYRAFLEIDKRVRSIAHDEGADMFPPIAALSKPEASASFACQFRHGRFGVNLNSNSKAPDGLHRALLSQVTSRLLGSEDFEIVDVCHHTVVPST
ncbi:transposase [Devosia sp.]|uniref:IS110 family transposase n=1 Tax=Devosia sp. TaxID=1871048 RepID=UPI0025F3EFDF|nr:transposase [Devosia sp.]MCR6633457.1 transposase [Devosia sp.]MCR6636027.1 transposase [Devosia sp.]